jgi:hypothetical protein
MRLRILLAVLLLLTACDDGEPVTAQTVVLSMTPATMGFGEVPLGAVNVRSLVVLNSGNAAWVPSSSPVVEGEGFSWRAGCDVAVGPGDACTLEVAFAPAVVGAVAGRVWIATTIGEPVITESSLSATATPATIVFTPAEINFGDVLAGDVRTATVTVENTGAARITTTASMVGDGGFFVGGATTRSAPLVLGSGDRATLSVAFRPTQSGDAAAQLVAEVCGPGCGPALQLSGAVTAPQLEASPRAIDFGAVDIGEVATTTVHVSNAGTGVLNVTEAALGTGVGAELSLQVSVPLPVLLNAGEGFDVDVVFAPLQGRADVTTRLNIASSDTRSPLVFIPITGSVDGPGLQLVPDAVHFGRLVDGTTRDSTVVVRSIGSAPVEVDRIETTNPAFTVVGAPPLPQTLAPGAALQFVVRATATAAASANGGAEAQLVVAGSGVADVVASLAFLAGTHGCAPVALVPHAQLGTVQIGAGTTGTVAIQNIGDAPCELEALVEGGGGFVFDAQFSALPIGLEELPPGAVGEVAFGFNAAREGVPSAIVELRFVDVAAALFVSASATVVRTSLTVAPAALAFGPRSAACGDQTSTAVLINDGGTSVTVTSVSVSDPLFRVSIPTLPLVLGPGSTSPVTATAYASQATRGTHSAQARFNNSSGLTVTLDLQLEVTASSVPIVERFTAPQAVSAVDILFVVDNSGSMQDDQQQLADNFAAFFADALTGSNDFRVGVTTTDVLSIDGAAGRLVGDVAVLSPSTFNLATEFAANVLVGTEGSGTELGLEAMRLALDPSRNVGFVRSTAALSVVFVSDEEDSGGDPLLVPSGLMRTPAEYAAILRSLKAGNLSNTPVLVSGVLAPGARRYEALINAFTGGTIDIRAPDWGPRLADFGIDTFSLARTFVLSSAANETTISVTVNGAATTAWSWDAERNAVVLDDNAPAGSDVVITYTGVC